MITPFITPHALIQPSAADVIRSLCDEAKSVEETGNDFEAWATKFGLSTDSRSAYNAWEAISKTTPRLKIFLGRRFKEFTSARHR